MKTLQERIIKRLEELTNNFTEDTIITMKSDNTQMTIRPCNFTGVAEYFLVYASFENTGFHNIEAVANYIIKYDENKQQHNKEVEAITDYFNTKILQGGGDWDWYSDWHKDVFGYRPHGMVCGEYVNPHTI